MEENLPTKIGDGRRPVMRNKKYAPATGIQSDFEKVLTSFVETKSVRYEEFAKIWREKKLSLICAGRQTDRETVEFMEECMKVAMKMFLPPYGFQARVGALYLLYGLYLTQPCLPKVKIRVTREDWEQVKSLQEEFIRQNHHDTNFILHRLLVDGAFFFCALSQEARSRYSPAEDSNKSMAEALREDRQRIDELFSEETLEQLNLIHNRYHQQKVRVAGPDASRPDRSLDVLLDKFPVSVRDLLKQHHERWRKKEMSRRGNYSRSLDPIAEGGESAESADQDSDQHYQSATSVGQRRARLKAMAFRGVKNKQRYKHRTLATEASSSEDLSPSPKKKRGRPRGSKNKPSSPRTAMATIAEQEEESAVTTETSALLHMPQFEEVPEEDKRPGRKRRGKADTEGSGRTAKQRKSGDQEDTQGPQHDEQSTSQAPDFPVKRGRGRPPKPGSSVPTRSAGRPRKTQLPLSFEDNSKKKAGEGKRKDKAVKEREKSQNTDEPRKSKEADNSEKSQPSREAEFSAKASVVELNEEPSPPITNEAKDTGSVERGTSSDPHQSTSEEPPLSCDDSDPIITHTEQHPPTTNTPLSDRVEVEGSEVGEVCKQKGDIDKRDKGSGKVGKKTGGGEGKGARLRIEPLQVSTACKGKKKKIWTL